MSKKRLQRVQRKTWSAARRSHRRAHLEPTGNLLNGPRWWKAPRGHRGSFARNLATSAFAASCAAVASLNFLISAGVVRLLPIGSAALFVAYAERSAAMAL